MLKGFILLYGSFDVLKFISLKMVQSKEPANLAKWETFILKSLNLSTDCGAHTVLSVGEGKMCNKLNHLMNFLTMWSPRHIYS